MSESPAEPVETSPEPVQAGEPVTIEPADPETVPAEAQAPAEDAAPVGTGASNESPSMPPSAQAAAAKAHAGLGHLIQVAQTVQRDIERYVPAAVLAAAEIEVKALVRGIL